MLRLDARFVAALAAAPVVWGVMIWVLPSGFQVGAVLAEPVRFLLLAGVYPVLEEIVFRGGLQGRLRECSWGLNRIGPLSFANVLTSVAFTLLHFLAHPPLAAALVFAPSLIFGYFRDRTNGDRMHGLGAPIALHCWYNAGYFLIFGVV